MAEEMQMGPPMELAQTLFLLRNPQTPNAEKTQLQSTFIQAVVAQNMTGLYELIFPDDEHHKLAALRDANKTQLECLQQKLQDAETNFGEQEVYQALLNQASFFARCGHLQSALTGYAKAYEKAVGAKARLDIVFAELYLGLFFMDHDLFQRSLERARELIDEGGDWDRRNRLKVYEGVYLCSIRDFKKASLLLLDSLATFTCTEIVEYKQFIRFTILTSVYALPRAELKKRVIDAPEVLEVIHELPEFEQLVSALYQCRYKDLFSALVKIEAFCKRDRYWSQHYRFYIRELRILAYTQLLESYRSVTMQSLAQQFGVSQEFVDREVSGFIAAGRLNCQIDKVGGVIETAWVDDRNGKYQQAIKQGDLLLNRIQKLGRVINI